MQTNSLKILHFLLVLILGRSNFCYNNSKDFGKVIYQSDDLIINQISANTYIHTSYLKTEDFGKVACNGMLVTDQNEALIFDTTSDDTSSNELIDWIQKNLHCKIKAVIPTHFHKDNLGGLNAFHKANIPSYAYFKTAKLALQNGFTKPLHTFKDTLNLKIGKQKIIVKFMGEGHTSDNVVGYIPKEHILFGGCLIKEMDADKGYLGDANISAWSQSVKNIKATFPNVKIIIPGHGKAGNQELLDYTIQLFSTN